MAKLRDIRPACAAQNTGYGPDADPEPVGEVSLAGPSCGINPADVSDVLWFKNNARMHGPSLGMHISDVVGVGAEEQMARAHAGWIVALMADVQSGGDRAVGQFPCEAMRSDLFVANLQSTVSVIPDVFVVPASFSFDGASPETLFKSSPSSRIRTRAATEATATPGNLRCLCLKPPPTMDAGHCDAGHSHVPDVAQEASHS